MSRRPTLFRQTDLARAIRTAKAEGVALAGARITKDGDIIVLFGDEAPQPTSALDQWMSKKRDPRKA